jgi:hypothetical protein
MTTNNPLRRLFSNLAVSALLLAQAAPGPAAAASATLIEQRVIAQQGLAIGLATITLKSQFTAFFGVGGTVGTCTSIGGGGSVEPISNNFTPTGFSGRVKIFFDAACTHVYLDETLSVDLVSASPVLYNLKATAMVYSKARKKVGTIAIANNKLSTPTASTIKLIGTQTFTSATAGAPKLHMALSCELPSTNSGSVDEDCSVGVAQDFSEIALAAASVTLVSLHIDSANKVTFVQKLPAKLYTGTIGALSARVSGAGKVSIGGASTLYGTDSLAGEAAMMVLFPPKPTDWNVTDVGHSAKFSIQLLNNTTRALSGSIATIGGGTLASIALDQSGTGTITYSDSEAAAVSSWVLSK